MRETDRKTNRDRDGERGTIALIDTLAYLVLVIEGKNKSFVKTESTFFLFPPLSSQQSDCPSAVHPEADICDVQESKEKVKALNDKKLKAMKLVDTRTGFGLLDGQATACGEKMWRC